MLVALLASVVTSAGYAQDADSDVEAKILATEHMWGQAYVSKDPKALERILDDAFVNVDSDGILQTKAEVVAEVNTSTAVQFLTESMVVHLHGNAAIVTGVFEIKGVDRGKPYENNKTVVGFGLRDVTVGFRPGGRRKRRCQGRSRPGGRPG